MWDLFTLDFVSWSQDWRRCYPCFYDPPRPWSLRAGISRVLPSLATASWTGRWPASSWRATRQGGVERWPGRESAVAGSPSPGPSPTQGSLRRWSWSVGGRGRWGSVGGIQPSSTCCPSSPCCRSSPSWKDQNLNLGFQFERERLVIPFVRLIVSNQSLSTKKWLVAQPSVFTMTRPDYQGGGSFVFQLTHICHKSLSWKVIPPITTLKYGFLKLSFSVFWKSSSKRQSCTLSLDIMKKD